MEKSLEIAIQVLFVIGWIALICAAIDFVILYVLWRIRICSRNEARREVERERRRRLRKVKWQAQNREMTAEELERLYGAPW